MIGKVIASILKDDTALTALVSENSIFPYVMNENTPLPAIIYTIGNIEPIYDKDGWAIDDCSFTVTSFSENYSLLQDIAKAVRNALELKSGLYEGITIGSIIMTGQAEGYNINEDVFLNRLAFSVNIKDF
jgi:hypothetical protein